MTETQGKLLELVKLLDRICRKHDIEYFLIGGSALGAIRHHGFIPWDDDIDVGMKRSMWEKFRSVVEQELPEGFEFVDYRKYKAYCNPIAKIVNTGTTTLFRASLVDDAPKGQFLEIFIHDCVPKEHMREHRKTFWLYCELMSPYLPVINPALNYEDNSIARYRFYKLLCRIIGKDRVIRSLEKKLTMYSEEESDYLLLGWGAASDYFPIENYSSMRYEKFEDTELPVPCRACDNMKIEYGNGWVEFPEDIDEYAHVTVENPEVESSYYLDTIFGQINKSKALATRKKIKETRVKMFERELRIEQYRLKLALQDAAFKLSRVSEEELNRLYSNSEYGQIYHLFSDYLKLKKAARHYSVEDGVPESRKRILVKALIMDGRINEAEWVTGMDKLFSDYDPKSSSLKNDIWHIAKAQVCFYDGLYEMTHDYMGRVQPEFEKSRALLKLRLRLALAENTDIRERDMELLNELLEKGRDLELLKIKGDIFCTQGRNAEADAIYDTVVSESCNGMDIMDIMTRRGRA